MVSEYDQEQKHFFSRFTFIFIYVSLSLCVHARCTWAPMEVRRGYVLDALELGLQVAVSHMMWMMGLDSGSLEEQQVLLTMESSLQPKKHVLKEHRVIVLNNLKKVLFILQINLLSLR